MKSGCAWLCLGLGVEKQTMRLVRLDFGAELQKEGLQTAEPESPIDRSTVERHYALSGLPADQHGQARSKAA